MNKNKRKKLKAAGWKVGSASEFLGLSQADAALINKPRRAKNIKK